MLNNETCSVVKEPCFRGTVKLPGIANSGDVSKTVKEINMTVVAVKDSSSPV